jgi:2-C-methyl-D-erythritol 2,4-cyclodiphosphate synthase
LKRLHELGWRIGNVDITIFAQEPKLGPIKATMREHLAVMLGLATGAVNVKAKTGEKVGAIGRAEAIGCQVAVLIYSPPFMAGAAGSTV